MFCWGRGRSGKIACGIQSALAGGVLVGQQLKIQILGDEGIQRTELEAELVGRPGGAPGLEEVRVDGEQLGVLRAVPVAGLIAFRLEDLGGFWELWLLWQA